MNSSSYFLNLILKLIKKHLLFILDLEIFLIIIHILYYTTFYYYHNILKTKFKKIDHLENKNNHFINKLLTKYLIFNMINKSLLQDI